MTQQQIGTPSVLNIDDSVILSSASYSALGIALRDPWNEVLLALETRSLDPATVVAGMDSATSPNAGNPFITRSYMDLKLGNRGLILIGQPGSDADYEGTTEAIFNTAIAALPPSGGVVAVLAGTYTFNSTVPLPESVYVIGVHPLSVTIQGTGDFPVFDLTGDNARLEFLSIENSSAISFPVINLTGDSTSITGCHVSNYSLLGVRMVGSKSYVKSCLITSDGSGIWLQGLYQFVEKCSFSGTLVGGALHFENSMCSALSNFIQDSVTGASYLVPSPTCVSNKLVANHFGAPVAVSASIDQGTGTIRYANTPDTPVANENNFLLALQSYTGQPLVDSTEMVLSNHFAHDTATDKDATVILSSLDLVAQRIYEERSWILTSDDPIFDSVGVPTFGVFSWDGTTLIWPDFAIRSLVPDNVWTISAGSSAVAAGEAVVLDVNRSTPGAITPTIKSLPLLLENPADANQYVMAFSPASSVLVWTTGFRLLTALTSFDVDGVPLPINRFVGVPTDPRNTPVMPNSFAIGDDLTEKISSESSLLRSLYEKTNLWEYQSANIGTSVIDMTPAVGSWLDLTNNAPAATPTHLLQLKGTTYGLFPAFDVYRWYRASPGDMPGTWGAIIGNPAVAPFASMSYVGTNIALLTCSGVIVTWDPDALVWSSTTPTTTVTYPLPSTRPVGYDAGGQCDFAFQTPYYSVFTLLDGRTLFYFKALNYLVENHRVFTETPKGTALLGKHFKDSGFNIARDNWIDTVDNGAYSTLQGLPLCGLTSPAVEITPQCYSSTIATVKWDSLSHESFSYDPSSGTFLNVAFSGSTYYIIGGGYGGSKLLSVVTIGTTTGFTDFTPHGWLTSVGTQEVICFGATNTNSEFTVVMGKVLSGSLGSPCFSWTRTVLGGVNSNKGAVGVIDRYDNKGSGDIHILASDLARSSRPTWWKYSRTTSSWTSATLADSGGSVTIAQAVAGSFTYNAATDRMAGYGIAASSIRFLVRDASRANRPTMFAFDGTTYSGIRLSETPLVAPADVAIAGADGNSVTQFYGGVYQKAWEASIWVTRETSGNQIKLFMYFASTNTWNVMSVGFGGTHLNGINTGTPSYTKRTGSLVGIPTLTDFVDVVTTKDIFVWTPLAGLLRGSLTGYLTGVTSATWTQFDKRQPAVFPIFSSTPMTTYSPLLGVSRNDLSIQVGSLAEKTLPVFGAGLTATVGGLYWFDSGTKVKQITSTIWAGLNRGGYLWIGNPAFSSIPQELTPNPATLRGDITVANLGYTDDFDWAFDGTQTQIVFVYKDLANASRLGFILYNTTTNAITHERGGASGVVPIGSTPQIEYNSINTSWSIVAQDATIPASNARLMFFRRLVGSSTWIEEVALASGAGRNPAKPIHHTDGSVIVVTESGASFNALVSMRVHATGTWTSIYITAGGGFVAPKFIKTLDSTRWWIFGSQGGKVAWSTDPVTAGAWSLWSGTPTLSAVGYGRVSTPIPLAQTSAVVVATSAGVDGATPASRELLIWRFDNSGAVKCVGAFTSKGRLQAASYSGEEEDGITDLSWTPDQKLLYGATRPTRTSLHWSLRGSAASWNVPHGDSLLGSGRFLTLGEKHFREQWGSTSGSGGGALGQDLIIEYPSLTTWTALPLAQRTSETDFTSLKWPFLTLPTSRLFNTGSPSSGLVDDAGLASGILITSASRSWPLVFGNTRWSGLFHTGASVFSQGGMLGLLPPVLPPVSSNNNAYFSNPIIGSNNLFKLQALAAITFNGTRTWKASPTQEFLLVGPVTYQIDTTLGALGSHLALEFNVASSLILDPTEVLSSWDSLNHNNTIYTVVVGETREQGFLLYPALGSRKAATLLTYGHLEPIEMTSPVSDWIYALPYKLDVAPLYEIINMGSTTFALKKAGSLKGIQSIVFTPSVQRQLALRRLLPMNGWFLYQTTDVLASSSRIQSLASLASSIVIFDK